jgi:ABC-2 type transport system ATP-binding protein
MPATSLDTSSAVTNSHLQAKTAIELNEITHRYGDRLALDGVSFEVRAAEMFGLLGPNGSGKTSLFRILSTLMLPSGGRAVIMNADAAIHPNAVRRHIGVVFQAKSVDVKLTARENLWHQGHLYGMHGAALNRRVGEMLAHVGLSERANERVETFSGGMLRRVEIAKGLMHRPAVLLLDEPTTGLDPGARHDVWNYLRILRESEGTTILVTTHLMEEAERCDRLAILNEGRLVALGTPSELRAEIGGDVIVLETAAPEVLVAKIKSRFGLEAAVIGDKVRVETQSGHRFVTDVVEAFKADVQSVSVSKPTLEDVFIRRTGHRFWTDDGREARK